MASSRSCSCRSRLSREPTIIHQRSSRRTASPQRQPALMAMDARAVCRAVLGPRSSLDVREGGSGIGRRVGRSGIGRTPGRGDQQNGKVPGRNHRCQCDFWKDRSPPGGGFGCAVSAWLGRARVSAAPRPSAPADRAQRSPPTEGAFAISVANTRCGILTTPTRVWMRRAPVTAPGPPEGLCPRWTCSTAVRPLESHPNTFGGVWDGQAPPQSRRTGDARRQAGRQGAVAAGVAGAVHPSCSPQAGVLHTVPVVSVADARHRVPHRRIVDRVVAIHRPGVVADEAPGGDRRRARLFPDPRP
jgi:hypothetical protein